MKPLAFAICLCAAAWQEPPTFRSTTRLVEVSFIATDRQGNAVTDLKAEEIILTDKGKARKPAFFRYDGEPPKEPPAQLPDNLFTNRAEFLPGPPRNLMAIVLDGLNTPPADQIVVRARVMRYLKNIPPDTRVALFLMGHELTVLHDFTDDAAALRARVQKAQTAAPLQTLESIPTIAAEAEQLLAMYQDDQSIAAMLDALIRTEMDANDQARTRRVEMTLSHLETLGRHLAGVPGRKNLVWISGGISILSIVGPMGFGPSGSIRSYEGQVRETSQRLASQGIALYIVEASGLKTGPQTSMAEGRTTVQREAGRGRYAQQTDTERMNADTVPVMNIMADVTGGAVVRNTNDLNAGAKQVAADLRGAYTVGFYANEEPDNKWHDLKLKSSRAGVKLRGKQGYRSEMPAASAEEWTQQDLSAVLLNPLGSSAIHLDAFVRPAPDAGPRTFDLLVQVDPNEIHLRPEGDQIEAQYEVALAEWMASGIGRVQRQSGTAKFPKDKVNQLTPADLRYHQRWTLAPGATGLRLLFRDKFTGRYGTLEVPLARIKWQ